MSAANFNTPPQTNPSLQAPTLQGQASIVEPRPLASNLANTEDVFLSPRVLDAGAFTRYSEMLKSIITQASSQGRTLEDFSTDAHAMIKRCDVTSEAINKRMQAGLRMIKMIDERASRTDLLLEKIQTVQPNSDAFADQIDRLIKEKLTDAYRKIDTIVADAQARVEVADAKARQAVALSDGHAIKLTELTARIEGQLAELDARIENTRNETSSTLIQILDRTDTVTKGLNTAIDQVLARAHEAGESLTTKIDEASAQTDARIVELNNSIEPLLEASQQAMRTLGIDPENPVFEDSPLARIEQLVERGETQLASLDRVYRQQEDLQSQAEGVKAVFGVWLVDAAQDLDVLEERKDKIVGPMSQAADKIAKLGPDLESNLEIASTKLTHLQIEQQALRQTIQASTTVANDVSQRMTNESGQLQALLDGSLHKLSTRVEQAGVWLGALIQRAESLGSTLPGAGQMNFGTQPDIQTPVATVAEPTPTPMPPSIQPVDQRTHEPFLESEVASIEEMAITQAMIEAAVTPALESPIASPPTRQTVSPKPPCLPIDAFSFEGASMIFEHKIN
ncbi:hypothetical protein COB72_07635 [bacterium]|nr:MAG: hypothetical protein COB72_07635 [bacterium]